MFRGEGEGEGAVERCTHEASVRITGLPDSVREKFHTKSREKRARGSTGSRRNVDVKEVVVGVWMSKLKELGALASEEGKQ